MIRTATAADIPIIAHHRISMFLAMGSATPDIADAITRDTMAYLHDAMPRGEYFGWLALGDDGRTVAAGAGAQMRRILPRPLKGPDGKLGVAFGREAIVLNVFTEPAFRRRGLARALMEEVIRWARQTDVEILVLHAAPDGRPLYERLGFAQTNEMRMLPGLLRSE